MEVNLLDIEDVDGLLKLVVGNTLEGAVASAIEARRILRKIAGVAGKVDEADTAIIKGDKDMAVEALREACSLLPTHMQCNRKMLYTHNRINYEPVSYGIEYIQSVVESTDNSVDIFYKMMVLDSILPSLEFSGDGTAAIGNTIHITAIMDIAARMEGYRGVLADWCEGDEDVFEKLVITLSMSHLESIMRFAKEAIVKSYMKARVQQPEMDTNLLLPRVWQGAVESIRTMYAFSRKRLDTLPDSCFSREG